MSKWLRAAAFNSSMSKIYHEKIDEVAAYSAFVEHWHQIVQIFKISDGNKKVTGDEITAVTNHFGKMIDLLLVDLQQLMDFRIKYSQNEHVKKTVQEKKGYTNVNVNSENSSPYKLYDAAPPTPMYDYFMGERILESILHWSFSTGEYVHTMQLELLKVYELILTHSHSELLVFKPITEPLLSLLHSCDTCIPLDVEKRLVVLLNLLWVNILHSTKLMDYFFLPKESEFSKRFLIFTLLLPFTHREGSLGQQARDTLLLCMTQCANNDVVAEYIAYSSNFCPILAAGLSGLYSTLPQTLHCKDGICFCLSPNDVAKSSDLQMFVNFLEFCNAVAQTSHPFVRKQLIDFLYQGFLLPVVGPSLSQNVSDELVAAIIYMEFLLKTVTEEGLRRAFLALLFLSQEFCEMPLITMLISNLHSLNLQLSLVVLNLFETLISMHCEDVMVSLVLQYLCPCTHIMLSQITKLTQPSFASYNHFLELLPNVCQQEDFLDVSLIEGTDNTHHSWSPESSTLEDNGSIVSSSFLQYLKDAKYNVRKCTQACSSWVWKYNGQSPSPHHSAHLLCSNKVASFGNPSSDISNSHCISLPPCINLKDIITKKKRTKSLPNFCSLELSHSEMFPHPKFYGEYDHMNCKYVAVDINYCTGELSNRVAPKMYLTDDDFFTNCMAFAHEDLGEVSHDSIDESSGYESFTFRGSRDGSPFRITGATKKYIKLNPDLNGNNDLSVQNTDLHSPSKSDDEFYQFLERCESPPISSSSEKMDDIDEAYALIDSEVFHLDYREKKMMLQNRSERFQSHRLSSSASSIDEIRNDFKGVETILHAQSKPTVGPFLEALLHLVDNLLTSNADVIILVMSCISKLAILPCSLLTSLLLNPSIVLQPSIRSLHQVLGQLKQRIDCILTPDDTQLLKEARTRLLNWSTFNSKAKCHESVNTFVRGPKRRSFSQTFSALWKRNAVNDRNLGKEIPLQNLPDGSGYRYFKSSMFSNQSLNSFSSASFEKQQAAICSVLLKDWLLELTAVAYEHTVNVHECLYFSIYQSSNMRAL